MQFRFGSKASFRETFSLACYVSSVFTSSTWQLQHGTARTEYYDHLGKNGGVHGASLCNAIATQARGSFIVVPESQTLPLS